MQVSRSKSFPRNYSRTPVAAAVVLALASPALLAQETREIEEIIVTSQKRTENMQDVPISLQALNNQSLRELNLQNFADYAKLLPSVAMEYNGTAGAGSSFSLVYMRGIATAGDGQATTSQPSVGMYLDELPITTIQGNLDIHLYDVARVEALAGPQGTLYGASSQAGTIRIITNKPDPSGFSASVSAAGDLVDGDDSGLTVEGYVNVPISDNAAIRLVGWSRSDAGWIDNKLGSRTFPGVASTTADDITVTNTDKVKDNYNTIDTVGARAALLIDLNDNWTVTPTVMYQKSEGKGSWGDDLSDAIVSGKYAVSHALPEFVDDDWWMVGLTIEGRIGNFDLVYSGSYLDRQVDGSFDYSDYSYFYDSGSTTGFYADLHFADTGARAVPNQFEGLFPPGSIGARVMPGALYTNNDGYTKENHEIRISTDPEKRVRGLLGFFWQHQYHDFDQHFKMLGGVGTVMEMNSGTDDPRYEDTVYLNSMFRNDRDKAVFASVSYDITDDVELTVGTRYFKPEVTVEGFFGFGLGFTTAGWSGTGEAQCNQFPEGQDDWFDKPCRNVRKGIKESDHVSRVNLSWNITDDNMVYFTWSEGYRPGGVQRNPSAGEYLSDFLTNIEVGWKSQWLGNRLQFNGALFDQDWKDIQVSFTGDNAITAVNNGPSASVQGLEAQLLWLPTDNLTISTAFAFYDTKLKDDYCCDKNGEILAPKGTKLPVTADFKGNVVARYLFPLGSFDAHVQGALAYNGSRTGDMEVAAAQALGELPAYTILDFSTGIEKDSWSLDLFVSNATGEDAPLYMTAECTIETCGDQIYGVRARPRTVSLRYTRNFD